MNHATASNSRRDCDALVNHFEDRIAHKDVLLTRPGRTRQLETSAVQLLVHHDRPGAIPGQRFQAMASLPNKHKQRTRAWLHPHPLSHHRAQPLAAESHVHRLQGNVDGQAVRDHRLSSAKVATTARSNSPSKPLRTWISASPTRTAIAASAASALDTRRADVGAATRPPVLGSRGLRLSAIKL